MTRSPLLAFWALATIGAMTTLGCKKEATDAPAEPAATDAAAAGEEEDALAGLSEADRAAALAQKICPVTGDALGSMGAPFKVTVQGREVFLCCEGCVDAINAEPDKYLAVLDLPAAGDEAAATE